MIGPSRRRRDASPVRDPFQLHTRIARQRTRSRRLMTASVVALAVSLGSWLGGAPLVWHAALIVASLLAALLIPAPPYGRWALGWIAERVGLSYQTAIETHERTDPYGLHAAAAERAYKRVRNLDPPRATSWWLPVLALALGLLLLPAASLPGLGGDGPGGAPPPAPQAGPEEVPQPELPTPDTLDPLADPDDPQRAEEPDEDGAEDSETDEELSGEGESEGQDEQQVLDRFLDNLREREPEDQEEQQPQGGAAPPNVEPTPQGGEPGEGDEQQEGDPQEGDPQPQDGTETRGEQGERDGEEQGGEPGEQPSEGEQQEQAGAEGEEGEESTPGGFDQGDDTPSDGATEGGDAPEAGDDDQGFGAGEQGSDERPSGALDGAPQEEPEFLEGQLTDGPENFGGLIRLPGREEVDLPTDVDPQAYLRAAEEAVTEGDLPVDYQEVIRNYFR